ncbi:membrane protein [Pontibacillus halophilus JSM 076056 = DSM 19796]|uniref:Membrane protein n=1 Tax=Pontibacillus halophilus JSM 076056 = DSM 19796 TaxID=1385510 RepID=A0A0A5GBK0_9BACI|nr:Bax inhibitor-1/YccA family protein [Pontibacillus halophilus]KGX90541.1 membrane protein [Pontibacillus halophilus JSM 076056 = DSM 19796]
MNNTNQQLLGKVLSTFTLSLAFACIGLWVGQYVPPALFLPLVILEFAMLLFAFFLRKAKKVGYFFLYLFTSISGMTMYPAISFYISSIGATTVLIILGVTTLIFIALSLYAWTTKRDLSFLGGILFSALLALLLVWLLHVIFDFGSSAVLVITIISIILFSGFIIYDINQIKHRSFTKEDVPLLALNLYINFINLFLDLLRLVNIFKNND